jgi:Spermine/spermidine synthase domain
MAHRRRAARDLIIRQEVGSGVAELLRDPHRPRAWTLLIDGTPQSHVDLDDPAYLDFEYMRRLGHVIDLAAPPGRPVRALHLGAGGLTLARYVAATRPGSRQLAAEIDGALIELVRRRLPSGPRGWLRVRIGDAREVLEKVPAGSADVVIADVFAAGRTPAHLTSAEFVSAAARALSADGLFAVNVADGHQLAHARAQAATARVVFGEVCLIADPGVLRGRRFGNLVLAAARRGLPVAGLTRLAATDPFPGRVVHGGGLERFVAGAKPVTDADARASPPRPRGLFGGPAPASAVTPPGSSAWRAPASSR